MVSKSFICLPYLYRQIEMQSINFRTELRNQPNPIMPKQSCVDLADPKESPDRLIWWLFFFMKLNGKITVRVKQSENAYTTSETSLEIIKKGLNQNFTDLLSLLRPDN